MCVHAQYKPKVTNATAFHDIALIHIANLSWWSKHQPQRGFLHLRVEGVATLSASTLYAGLGRSVWPKTFPPVPPPPPPGPPAATNPNPAPQLNPHLQPGPTAGTELITELITEASVHGLDAGFGRRRGHLDVTVLVLLGVGLVDQVPHDAVVAAGRHRLDVLLLVLPDVLEDVVQGPAHFPHECCDVVKGKR